MKQINESQGMEPSKREKPNDKSGEFVTKEEFLKRLNRINYKAIQEAQ
jgi:hypothetical protein